MVSLATQFLQKCHKLLLYFFFSGKSISYVKNTKGITGYKFQAYSISFLLCPCVLLSLHLMWLHGGGLKERACKGDGHDFVFATEVSPFVQLRSLNGPLLLRTIFLPSWYLGSNSVGFSKPGMPQISRINLSLFFCISLSFSLILISDWKLVHSFWAHLFFVITGINREE